MCIAVGEAKDTRYVRLMKCSSYLPRNRVAALYRRSPYHDAICIAVPRRRRHAASRTAPEPTSCSTIVFSYRRKDERERVAAATERLLAAVTAAVDSILGGDALVNRGLFACGKYIFTRGEPLPRGVGCELSARLSQRREILARSTVSVDVGRPTDQPPLTDRASNDEGTPLG